MKGEDVLRQLSEADPAPPQRVQGASKGAAARESLERILDGAALEEPRRAPRRAPVGIAAALATAVIVIAVVVMQPADVELPEVRAVLSQASETAQRAASPQPGPGQFLYMRAEVTKTFMSSSPQGKWTALLPVRQEFWIAADGSGRLREVPGHPAFPGPRDRARWLAAGKPRIQGPISDRIVEEGTFGPDIDAEGSTGVQRLASALLATEVAPGLPEDQRLFLAASDLLSTPLASSSLRSALYDVLARIDQVELLGMVPDPKGRPGIGVAIPTRLNEALARRVLIFDEETSEVLAEEVVVLERVGWIDATPPIIVESRVLGPIAVVDSDQARPDASAP